jgi:hypothetical protein
MDLGDFAYGLGLILLTMLAFPVLLAVGLLWTWAVWLIVCRFLGF